VTAPVAAGTDVVHPGDDPQVGALLSRCSFPPAGEVLVCAVSGGPDSTALAVLAVAAGCRVTAVHVDHGLRPGSAEEAEVVAATAARLGCDFRAVRVVVDDGPNLEARAREARRRAIGPGAATGHTMDDQAETVLGNLLRGAGVHGLAGMRAGPAHPLLALRRHETVALCAHLGLATVRDPSNDDPRFVRNRVRAELLPLCADIAGRDVVPVLARQAALLADDADLLDAVAEDLDPTDAASLSAASPARARRAVRRWLADPDGYPPPADAVERVLGVARLEHRATEVPGGVRVSRSSGRLTRGSGAGPGPGSDGAPPVQS
jgi:tRNA(Ile)-lysidine synthase